MKTIGGVNHCAAKSFQKKRGKLGQQEDNTKKRQPRQAHKKRKRQNLLNSVIELSQKLLEARRRERALLLRQLCHSLPQSLQAREVSDKRPQPTAPASRTLTSIPIRCTISAPETRFRPPADGAVEAALAGDDGGAAVI